MKTIALFLQDMFEWSIFVGTIGGSLWVMVKVLGFIYKVAAGTYHLLDKLIDHL